MAPLGEGGGGGAQHFLAMEMQLFPTRGQFAYATISSSHIDNLYNKYIKISNIATPPLIR